MQSDGKAKGICPRALKLSRATRGNVCAWDATLFIGRKKSIVASEPHRWTTKAGDESSSGAAGKYCCFSRLHPWTIQAIRRARHHRGCAITVTCKDG